MIHEISAKGSVSLSERNLGWMVLPILLLAATVIYYPRAIHNLPVAATIDDRTSLSVLVRFHQGSANPKFFMYPTLYYYLTYALTAPFGFNRILLTGHLLNLGLVGVTGWLSYIFCVRHFGSRAAGIIAAVCLLFSPLLVTSGAYLCTDVLLSAMTILSLDRLITYFESGRSRDWIFAMIAIGCAIATKYTAAILFVTYFLVECAQTYRRRKGSPELLGKEPVEAVTPGYSNDAMGQDVRNKANDYIGRGTLSIALGVISVLFGLAAIFFPVNAILHFVFAHRTNPEARSLQEYFGFLQRMRHLAMAICAGSAILLALSRWSRTVYECLALKRPYYGALILVGIFVITTPYSVLDPGKFVYDIGALMRANVVVAGGHQQWAPYWHWLMTSENNFAVVLGIVGVGLMGFLAPWRCLPAVLYFTLYVLTICSSHLGVQRYLDPILPLLYCGTGLMMYQLWRGRPRSALANRSLLWRRSAVLLLGLAALGTMVRTAARNDAAASQHDAFYASYVAVLQDSAHKAGHSDGSVAAAGARAGTVLYGGYAPAVELGLAGFQTQLVSWEALAAGPLGNEMTCDDLLILNATQSEDHHITPQNDRSVSLLLDDRSGAGTSAGQIVARRKDCP